MSTPRNMKDYPDWRSRVRAIEHRSPFNDYDERGYRTTRRGNRSSRIEDEAILYNLRTRWPKELEHLSDQMLIDTYDDFARSDMFGDNDARFLEWMEDVES